MSAKLAAEVKLKVVATVERSVVASRYFVITGSSAHQFWGVLESPTRPIVGGMLMSNMLMVWYK